MLKKLMSASVAVAMLASSTVAAAAPISANSLSVAKSVRATSTAGKSDQLRGGTSFLLIAIAVALVALGVVAVADDGNDSPDSP